MNNYIVKTLAYNKQARILFMENTKMVQEICNNKDIRKPLKTALGRTVSIASLISGTLKDNQRVSIKVSATNRKYKIFADTDSTGNVRGYINNELLNAPLSDMDNLEVEQLLGEKGCLQVLKDIGMNGIFTGITDMPYGNIVDDFSYYFEKSEQIPSFFSIILLYNENNEVILSRGVFAQLLPGAPSSVMDSIKEVIADKQSTLYELQEETPFKEIPCTIFEDIKIVGFAPIQYFCGCSKEMLYPMLYSLNKEELIEAYQKNKSVEMVCNSCGRKYSFTPEEIRNLL